MFIDMLDSLVELPKEKRILTDDEWKRGMKKLFYENRKPKSYRETQFQE